MLGLVELGLRVAGDPPVPDDIGSPFAAGGTLVDPDYGWRLMPGAVVGDPVRQAWELRYGRGDRSTLDPPPQDIISKDSFRDTALAEARPRDQRRVLALGDSSVYGSGVPVDRRFTEIIERSMNPPGLVDPKKKVVEIINGGVPGWTTAQSLQQLEDSLHLGLDAIIVYDMNSDLMQSEGGVPDYLYFAARRRLRRGDGLAAWSITRWLRYLLAPLQVRSGGRPIASGTGLRVPLGPYRSLLRQIAAVCRAQQMGLVFVIPSQAMDLMRPMEDYLPAGAGDASRMFAELDRDIASGTARWGKREYRMAMAQVAAESSAPIIDAPAAFIQAQQSHPQDYRDGNDLFVDAIHPSVTGHALLASLIQPALEQVLADTAPWPERRKHVPTGRVPAWRLATLGDRPSAPSTRPAVSMQPDDLDQDLPCTAVADPTREQLTLRVHIDGVAANQAVRVGLLQPGPAMAREVVHANCHGPDQRITVPRAPGLVRVVASVDGDGDGPCYADPAGAGAYNINLGESPATVSISLGNAAALGAFAPPYGLPPGVYPLLAQLAGPSSHASFASIGDGESVGVGLIIEPAALKTLDVLAATHGARQVLREAGSKVQLVDVLDRPHTLLSAYDGLVVVASLGSDLTTRAAAAMRSGARVTAGWTDPAGLSWSLILPEEAGEQARAQHFARRVADDELLAPDEGFARASSGRGPVLPPELAAP